MRMLSKLLNRKMGLLLISLSYWGVGISSNSLVLRCESGLDFGSVVAGGSLQKVISPNESGAAVFTASGTQKARFVLQIISSELLLYPISHPGLPITVSDFRFGGAVSKEGQGRLDKLGDLTNIRLGAKAKISMQNYPGTYAGEALMRITYI